MSKPMAVLSRPQPQWPFYQQRPLYFQASGRNGQIFKFGLRIADFILPRTRSLSAARPSHFYQGLSRPASGRFIKADGRYIKAGQFYQQWPLYQPNIAPYKQFISGQAEPFLSRVAILSKPQWPLEQRQLPFWQSEWPLYHGQPQWPFYQSRWPLCQGQPASMTVINKAPV